MGTTLPTSEEPLCRQGEVAKVGICEHRDRSPSSPKLAPLFSGLRRTPPSCSTWKGLRNLCADPCLERGFRRSSLHSPGLGWAFGVMNAVGKHYDLFQMAMWTILRQMYHIHTPV